ncbi:hypothetical protein [Citrobacter werkmanii]|uniref:hypothetical protein n=1 Tax=Citrobacter werkmanii TaxID=67827 RepID=UPI00127AB4E0|nr:hypothetical protein [Salmonella enterica]EAZ9261380.1 hypothetical protein [Salmonella enterica]EBN2521025.1 hypothetical protein [Salmonella enterica]
MLCKLQKKNLYFITLLLVSECLYGKGINLSLDDVAMFLYSRGYENATESNEEVDSECIEAVNFLQSQNSKIYNEYVQKYHKLAIEYQFLIDNKKLMKGDTEELYVKTLNMKRDMLCSNAKLEVLSYMKGKVTE